MAAATHLFARKGFHGTTVRDVAVRAGISPGLIYNYFPDKEQLLLLVFDDLLEAHAAEIPAALARVSDPVERFAAVVEAYCRVNAARPEGTLLAYQELKSLRRPARDVISRREAETSRLIAGCVADCVKAGVFRAVDVELIAYRVVMVAHGWALKGWRLSGHITLEHYITGCIDLFLQSLLTSKGRRLIAARRDGRGARGSGRSREKLRSAREHAHIASEVSACP